MPWYFAYGSNMQTATLRGRRGIEFRQAVAARARGWQVVFDKPPLFPIGESFANLIAAAEGDALGVVYEIGDADLEHIKQTEGVAVENYAAIELEVESLGTATTVAAVSLSSNRRDPQLQPSARYMELVIAGALEHRLPDEYIVYLRSVSTCGTSALAEQMRPLVDDFLRRKRKV